MLCTQTHWIVQSALVLRRPWMSYRGLVSDRRGALSEAVFTSRNSEPLVSHSLWKLNSLFRLVGERPLRLICPLLSGRKKAKRRERITEPAPNRNGAPDTIVCGQNTNYLLLPWTICLLNWDFSSLTEFKRTLKPLSQAWEIYLGHASWSNSFTMATIKSSNCFPK